jgi:hypothetical protein
MKSDPRAKSMKRLERVKGIEPSYSAWKAAALPLSYTRAGQDMQRAGSICNSSSPRQEHRLAIASDALDGRMVKGPAMMQAWGHPAVALSV